MDSKHILIIEDNTEVRENLAEILELSNFQVTVAENGRIGVQKALLDPPDLILCDVMMPELDGFGVLHILSKKPATSGIPFIFLTAKTEKTDFRKGMNLGADDYITKPFDDVELLDAIEIRLKKAERIKTQFDRSDTGITAFINEARGYEALKKLSNERTSSIYRKKEVVYRENELPRYLYFILSGKVKTFKTDDDGKELIISIHGEGDFFGYLDLLQDQQYGESVATLEETELRLVPREDFLDLIHQNRDVSAQLIKILAQNVAEKENLLLQLAYRSVRKRVAKSLLALHDSYYPDSTGPITILREDLANIVGTAKESVIRMLSEFREDGTIKIEDGAIHILNRQKLENTPG